MRKGIGALMTLVVAAGMLVDPSQTSEATARNCSMHSSKVKTMVRKVNRARTNAGRVRVDLDADLSRVALKHSKAMVRESKLYHTPADVLRRRVTNFELLGENVGVGRSLSWLHREFMRSEAHRRIVLKGSFRHVGIGIVRTGDRIWMTVLFESYYNPGSRVRVSC